MRASAPADAAGARRAAARARRSAPAAAGRRRRARRRGRAARGRSTSRRRAIASRWDQAAQARPSDGARGEQRAQVTRDPGSHDPRYTLADRRLASGPSWRVGARAPCALAALRGAQLRHRGEAAPAPAVARSPRRRVASFLGLRLNIDSRCGTGANAPGSPLPPGAVAVTAERRLPRPARVGPSRPSGGRAPPAPRPRPAPSPR